MKQIITCDLCNLTFSSLAEMSQHQVKKHGDGMHRCTYCGLQYTLKNNLTRHVTSVHAEEVKDVPQDRGGRRPGQTFASGNLNRWESIDLKVRPKEGEQLPETREFNFIEDRHLYNSPQAGLCMARKPWEVFNELAADEKNKDFKPLHESYITTYSFDSGNNFTTKTIAGDAKKFLNRELQGAIAEFTVNPNSIENIHRDFTVTAMLPSVHDTPTPSYIKEQLEAYEQYSSVFHSSQAGDIPADLLPRNPEATVNLFGVVTGNLTERPLQSPAFVGSNQSATFPYQPFGQSGSQIVADGQVSPIAMPAPSNTPVLSFGSIASDKLETPPAYVPVERESGKRFNPKQAKTVAMFKSQLNMDLGRRRMQ